MENEVTGTQVSDVEEVPITTGDQGLNKKAQNKRKKKNYGKDFDGNDDRQ